MYSQTRAPVGQQFLVDATCSTHGLPMLYPGDRQTAHLSVFEGVSPKIWRYLWANRPSSQKPCSVAIEVTLAMAGSACNKLRLTARMRRSTRYCVGLTPSCVWHAARKVRPETPMARLTSGMYNGRSAAASSIAWK